MNLQTYLQQQGGTVRPDCPVTLQVARAAGCAPSTLYMIALGHKKPSWRLAAGIQSATDGQVARADLRPDVFGPASEARDAA